MLAHDQMKFLPVVAFITRKLFNLSSFFVFSSLIVSATLGICINIFLMLVANVRLCISTDHNMDFLIRLLNVGYSSSDRGNSGGAEDVPAAFQRSPQFNQPRLFEQRQWRLRRGGIDLGGASDERSPGKLQRHF